MLACSEDWADGGSGVTPRFAFVGESTAPADLRRAELQAASPGYFATLRAPMLSGSAFTPADLPTSEPAVIVDETLAKTQSAGSDPVGRRIAIGRQTLRVVGVVADIRDDGLDVPWPRDRNHCSVGADAVHFSLLYGIQPADVGPLSELPSCWP